MKLRDWSWAGLNGLMGLLFLWLSSRQWIEPELKDITGASGGAPLAAGATKLFAVMVVAWIALVLFSASRV